MTPVTLASQSQVRGRLLRAAGVVFETVSPGVDEAATKQRLADAGPREVAQALAREKALAAGAGRRGLTIGADQTLEFDGALVGKAADLAMARARLMDLRGRDHSLHSAVAVARDGSVIWEETASAYLSMREFSPAWLDGYLARNPQVLASVGCYELEGEGAQLFSRIDGDYFAILGLPLLGLLDLLRREGALAS